VHWIGSSAAVSVRLDWYSVSVRRSSVRLSGQQMQKYEAGRNRVSAARLFLICQLLQVRITFIFEGFDANRFFRPDN
jgi:hypothetical protein